MIEYLLIFLFLLTCIIAFLFCNGELDWIDPDISVALLSTSGGLFALIALGKLAMFSHKKIKLLKIKSNA